MTRLLAILALVSAACAIREPRTSGVSGEPCSRNEDCDSSACFLGECRAPSSALSTVYAEVRSGDSRFGTVQKAVDARATAVADFTLQPVLTFSGRVVQRADPPGADAPISDASVVFTDLAPRIPDRILSTSTQSDSSGTYTTTLPASTYQVRVAPPNLPVEQFGPLQTSNTAFDLALPPASLLAHVHGILMNGTTPLAGAQVSAVDATGTSIAASAVSGPDGSFLLTLPPGPPAFSLQVGPQTTPSAGDATPSFKAISFAAGVGLDLGSIPLGAFPPPATLSGRIVDLRGAPVPSARVLVLSTGAPGYVLSRQVTTDANGAFAVLVREGDYLVEAMPDADSQAPAMSGVVSPHVGAGGTNVPIQCPDKITVRGTVIRPDGKPAPTGFRVEATRLQDQLGAGRGTQTATTDANGAFALVVDGGKYRVTITPTSDSGLPRTILTVDLPGPTPPVLHIAPAHELLGTVRVPGDPGKAPAPAPGATIDFYALDASGKRSVLIGSAVADSTSGQYKVILPDVPQPAGQ